MGPLAARARGAAPGPSTRLPAPGATSKHPGKWVHDDGGRGAAPRSASAIVTRLPGSSRSLQPGRRLAKPSADSRSHAAAGAAQRRGGVPHGGRHTARNLTVLNPPSAQP
ncbi:hypothetical protein PSU4_55100 [Pseudonocardia sulfidoxydans NBRC 16205]|uniref:Uncharacterized protein n=1 Tax=Pseudonocardia sulfidoxydans NBRC 16205 TaxID=1223511 RepID=A0A511DP12_9PSEU|nr:hypothetical protein PSU4_55100 [Pseudonocardia sulfidoxydans NBRC 16205]